MDLLFVNSRVIRNFAVVMSERIKKINDLLRDEVGKILLTELRIDDGILVTVMGARVSPTLEHATLLISIMPKEKSRVVLRKISQQIYFIQQMLNKHLAMHPVPKIRFEIDASIDHAARIDAILQKGAK